jgi:hypothetical protein
LIEDLLALPSEDGAITLDGEAAAAFVAFETALEPRLGPDGDLEALQDWGSKLAGFVAPPAGVTREGILQLDNQMLARWKSVLESNWNPIGIGDKKGVLKKSLVPLKKPYVPDR